MGDWHRASWGSISVGLSNMMLQRMPKSSKLLDADRASACSAPERTSETALTLTQDTIHSGGGLDFMPPPLMPAATMGQRRPSVRFQVDACAWEDDEHHGMPPGSNRTMIYSPRSDGDAQCTKCEDEDPADHHQHVVDPKYIDATLMKPDDQVFNKYTCFFMDHVLEELYQEYTAVHWFSRARWHILLWILVHGLVSLLFVILPSSGLVGLNQFVLSYERAPAWTQWLYLLGALPFACIPTRYNPFQTRWRAWVCLVIIVFDLCFQIWLASANRLAYDTFAQSVDALLVCSESNSSSSSSVSGSTVSVTEASASSYAEETVRQKVLALSMIETYAGALVQLLAGFASLFSFLFSISVRLEFVQVMVVGACAVGTYVLIICVYQLNIEWMTSVSYAFTVFLLFILSHSSDRINRRSFLSTFLLEKENESMKSSISRAEAALMNGPAGEEEKKTVESVLGVPEMKDLDEFCRIPFGEITLLQAIGRGAMGDVIKAKYLGTMVVCKRLRRENITEATIWSFREEIQLMACLRHPNIVQFMGASWDNPSNLCIVMEYMENGDMHSVLHSTIGKNFTWSDPLLKMAIDAVQGMLYLHSQEPAIVHRDLKSVNILCSTTYGCKVGDFGLSRRYNKDIDALTTIVGTPFWLAPEIIRNESYGSAADVYSFGIVLTELETRRTPYHDQAETGLKMLMRISQEKLRPTLPSNVPPSRRALIHDCLRDHPKNRPTFAQILARLQGPVHQEIEDAAAQIPIDRRVLRKQKRQPIPRAILHG